MSTVMEPGPKGPRWSVEQLPFPLIDRARVMGDPDLFYMLVSASFVEITSDLYTQNLVDYFDGDAEVQQWLEHQWQHEEVQHGFALKRYVTTVWPEFDWDEAYRRFFSDYARVCIVENLGPTRALELVARCVVETGTATMYTLLGRLTDEPVLRLLTDHIRRDEVRHYGFFYHHFVSYQRDERPSRTAILRTLWSRVAEIDNEDAYYAFKHVFMMRHPSRTFTDSDYHDFRRRLLARARGEYPFHMAAKMVLKPLALGRHVQRAAVPLLTAGARHLFLR